MRLVTVGTGAAAPSPHRVCAGHLVAAGDVRLLMDCGSGVVHRMAALRLDWRAITHVAKEARRPRAVALDDELPDPATTPDKAAEQAEARNRLENAVMRLPLGQRLVVTLALEDFSPDEIAAVLGIGASAASVRLHRAKAQLQQILKGSR